MCIFATSSVEYLDHCIDGDGLYPTDKKVRAIRGAPITRNHRALLIPGSYELLRNFLPQLSTVLASLYRLLKKGTHWVWPS